MATSAENAGTGATMIAMINKDDIVYTALFKKHKCDKCGTKYRKIEELMQHQQIAHEASLYVCNQCQASFEGMEQMRDHAKKFHSYRKRV